MKRRYRRIYRKLQKWLFRPRPTGQCNDADLLWMLETDVMCPTSHYRQCEYCQKRLLEMATDRVTPEAIQDALARNESYWTVQDELRESREQE